MRIPISFPDFDQAPPEFIAFVLLAGTVMESVSDGSMDPKQGMITLWLATRPGTTGDVTPFTEQLTRRLDAEGMIPKLGLPEGTEFRAAGVRFTNGDENLVEMLCVGLHMPEGWDGPPPDAPPELEGPLNIMVAEAAAEAGFVVSNLPEGAISVVVESPGIDDALKAELNKKIEEEAARFRAELDSVFDTWKGGTNQ